MSPDNFRTAVGAFARRWCLPFLMLAGLATGSPVLAAGPFGTQRAVPLHGCVPAVEDSLTVDHPSPHLSRALAAALAVTLGPFGAHRLYLGTRPKVPLLYGLTFGGFGVLVLIDLGHILCTRDLSVFQDSGQVLMWARPREGEKVTPP